MKVSVAVLCYNHAPFIKKALDSILIQKLDFPFEIVIGDDASTDESQEILQEYKKLYPEKIRLILKKKNEGVFKNIMGVIKACSGQYIALLETDDFWTNPQKLSKQISFLDENPDYTGCFHNTAIEWLTEANNDSNLYMRNFKSCAEVHTFPEEFYPHHLMKGTFIPTSSLVFRNRDFEDELHKLSGINHSLAWGMAFFFIKKNKTTGGKFKYINEQWSTYMKNEKSLTFVYNASHFTKAGIQILEILLKDTCYQYFKSEIYRGLCNKYEIHYGHLRAENNPNYKSSIFYFFKYSVLFTFYRTKQFYTQK